MKYGAVDFDFSRKLKVDFGEGNGYNWFIDCDRIPSGSLQYTYFYKYHNAYLFYPDFSEFLVS